MEPDQTDLGPCCRCGKTDDPARNVFMLPVRGLVPGHGWGCFECQLSSDGALAVFCDPCCSIHGFNPETDLEWACRGYPRTEGRVRLEELTTVHDHDLTKHLELPPEEVFPRLLWFTDSPDEGDPNCICSACVRSIAASDDPPALRMWSDDGNLEMRFHHSCATSLIARGVLRI